MGTWFSVDVMWSWQFLTTTLLSPFIITYLVSLFNSSTTIRNLREPRRPPTAPYFLPYIGHANYMVTKPEELFGDNLKRYGRDGIWKLVLPGLSAYQIASPENIGKVFRGQGMLLTESHARSYENSFGMPPEAARLFGEDDSGYGPHPDPSSSVKQGERILLQLHNLVNSTLTGESLTAIAAHYQEQLIKDFTELGESIGDDWMEVSDLRDFFRQRITKSALTSIWGPHLIRLNPNLVQDLWDFFPSVANLFLGAPRVFMPKAYRLREKLLDGIATYYEHAHEHYMAQGADEDWDEHFGCRLSRMKHRGLWNNFDKMNARARAAEDLSFMWASNANSVEAATWAVVEILRDPSLLERVQAEIDEARHDENAKSPTLFDLDKLCALPVSQAVYAEVLRLRVAIMIFRKARHDLDFSGWSIKKGERVSAPSILAHHNDEIWNTGTVGEPHPLTEFWADRFLVHPDEPNSGPLKDPISKDLDEKVAKDGPVFSMTGLTNTWMPYSGGVRHCPGRHFAKQEIILTAAAMISFFDIELKTPDGWVPRSDPAYFGHGTMPILGKVPVRIRRRREVKR